MSTMFDLTGKTAVIVGGTSVLGSAMAEGLAAHGAKIALVAIEEDLVQTVAERYKDYPGGVKAFYGDVTKRETMEQAAKDIEDWAGGFDIILNCPGRNSPTPFFEIPEDEWDGIMAVNLKGVFLTCQVFAKRMVELERPGSIINISSVSSQTPLSRVFTYSASKAGINSITQFLARELAPNNIRVNAIIPGFFPAEQNRRILSEERINSIMGHTPMNRFGNPEELQGVCVWLASDQASSFVTGALIPVDGGFLAMTI